MRYYLLSAFLASIVHADYYCPNYDDIKQPSVAPEVWSQEELTGIWYLVATNEPTIPTDMMRECGVLNWTVYTSVYRYTNTVTQAGVVGGLYNFTVTNGGYKSTDPERPGDCMETIAIMNKTVDSTLTPNRFFNYSAGADGFYMSYACIGEFAGRDLYSFFLASRTPFVSEEWIAERVHWVNSTGFFNLEGLVMSSGDTRRSLCWGE